MRGKRFISILLTLVMVIVVSTAMCFAEGEIKVLLDGEELVFDVAPQLINDRTMVPMRKIFEAMGASVEWEDNTQTVTAVKGDIIVVMQIDNKVIKVNGKEITLDVPPQLVSSRTLVPVRAVAESLDAQVDWDEVSNTVIITSTDKNIEDIYKHTNPTIDFSGDDGIMSELHRGLRLLFEQEALPKMLFENSEKLKVSIVEQPEEFLTFVDNEVWSVCMNNLIVRYMANSEEEYVISSEDDIYKYINELSDKYHLHAYENYDVDAVKLSDNQYLILLNMADISDSLKVSDLDKMLISSYIGILYDSSADCIYYYLLEKSIDDRYALCSINESGEHFTYGFINNTKKDFVENIKLLLED
ncbi:MAG: copper amine oxidase N-terminal domain-containing protein [Eubacteriales bacterium]|nr:copper amine oxidase N-terminal domain-containing protein [Eubacteriales bacterium]